MLDRNKLPVTVKEYLRDLYENQDTTIDTVENYGEDIYLFLRFLKAYKKTDSYETIGNLETIDLSKIKENYFTKLTEKDIKTFISWLSNKGNSNSSKNRRISALKSFTSFLIDENILKIDIMRKIKSFKVKNREQDYLTEEESKELLAVTKENCKSIQDYLIINIYINLGLRLDELRELKISDIRGNKLNIIGKGRKQRIQKIPNSTMKIIDEWLKEREEEYVREGKIKDEFKDFLFISNRGKAFSEDAIPKMIKRYLKLTNIPKEKNIHTHSLRHTFISRMYENTKDIKLVSKLAGHSQVTTTQRYIHQDEDKLDRAIEDYSLE